MKALSGGLIVNAVPTFAFIRQLDNVVPIWGIQKMSELEQLISLENSPPVMDSEMLGIIEKDRQELSSSFCRGCGYCMPCPTGIPIPMAARMSLLLKRAPYQSFLSDKWKANMDLINDCIECGQCSSKCPYGLDTPRLLKKMYSEYIEFYNQKNCK